MSNWKDEYRTKHPWEKPVPQRVQEEDDVTKIQRGRAKLAHLCCHMLGCPVKCTGPLVLTGHSPYVNSDGYLDSSTTVYEDKPENLFRCCVCNQWTCEGHFLEGACQSCWVNYGESMTRLIVNAKIKANSFLNMLGLGR